MNFSSWLKSLCDPLSWGSQLTPKPRKARELRLHSSVVESLEDRALLSASAVFDAVTQELHVTASKNGKVEIGTNNKEQVTLNGRTVRTSDQPLQTESLGPTARNRASMKLDASAVTGIEITGGAGRNKIDVAKVTDATFRNLANFTIIGDAGEDTILRNEFINTLADVHHNGTVPVDPPFDPTHHDGTEPTHHDGTVPVDPPIDPTHHDGTEPTHHDGTVPVDPPVDPTHHDGTIPTDPPIDPTHHDGTEPTHHDGTVPVDPPVDPTHHDGTEPTHHDGTVPADPPIDPTHHDGTIPTDPPVDPTHHDGTEPTHHDGSVPVDPPIDPTHHDGSVPTDPPVDPTHHDGTEPTHHDGTVPVDPPIDPTHHDGSVPAHHQSA
jgi:hypothetical protein